MGLVFHHNTGANQHGQVVVKFRGSVFGNAIPLSANHRASPVLLVDRSPQAGASDYAPTRADRP